MGTESFATLAMSTGRFDLKKPTQNVAIKHNLTSILQQDSAISKNQATTDPIEPQV